MMPNLSEDAYRTGICIDALGFLDNLIPHGTEVVLQSRKGITYVEFAKFAHDIGTGNVIGAIGMACELDQVGE